MQKNDIEKCSIYISRREKKSQMIVFLSSAILQILQSCYARKTLSRLSLLTAIYGTYCWLFTYLGAANLLTLMLIIYLPGCWLFTYLNAANLLTWMLVTQVTSNDNYRECSLNNICSWKRDLMFTEIASISLRLTIWGKCELKCIN